MQKARYSMWTKRKHDLSTHVLSSAANPSYGDSWEEQAFAEDAAGDLGGCIWPPRSYTCSFCRREFRSAQALGGHMNVHRRDRAILKQSPCSQTEAFPHKNILNPFPPLEIQYQPQTCNFLYNPNFDTDHKVLASPSSPFRVLAPTTKVNTDEYRFDPCLFPVVQEQRKTILPYFSPRSNMATDKYFRVSDMKNEEKKTEIIESNSRVQREFFKADLSVSLNLVVCRNPSSSSDDAEEGGASCKRRRIEATPLNFFPKQYSVDMNHLQSPRSIDDLDLELRLGDPPKAKVSLLDKIHDSISLLALEIAGFDYSKGAAAFAGNS